MYLKTDLYRILARLDCRFRRTAVARIFVVACCGLLVLADGVWARSELTNLALLARTIERAADNALDQLETVDQAPFFLVPQTKHEANWLAEHILSDRLLQRGLSVQLDSTAADTAMRLSYRLLELGVSGQTGLLKGSVERRSRCVLALRLSRGGDLVWQDESESELRDKIPRKRMDLLQNKDHKFAQTDLEEQTLGKFVEPVIVTTVLGGLIYIFFSNR